MLPKQAAKSFRFDSTERMKLPSIYRENTQQKIVLNMGSLGATVGANKHQSSSVQGRIGQVIPTVSTQMSITLTSKDGAGTTTPDGHSKGPR